LTEGQKTEERRGFSKYEYFSSDKIKGIMGEACNTYEKYGKRKWNFNRKHEKKKSFLKLWRRDDDDKDILARNSV